MVLKIVFWKYEIEFAVYTEIVFLKTEIRFSDN